MTVPTNYQTEYIISSLGDEKYPQTVYLNNTLWTFFINSYKLYVKKSSASAEVYSLVNVNSLGFAASNKVNQDGSFDTSLCWIWSVGYLGEVTLYEVQPLIDAPPIITRLHAITSDGISLSTYIKPNNPIRLTVIKNIAGVKKLFFYKYNQDPFSETHPGYELDWDQSNLDTLSTSVDPAKTSLTLNVVRPGSPTNVYAESYSVPTPQNLRHLRVESTPIVEVSWDPVAGADLYYVEKDVSTLFTSPTTTYYGSNVSYNDTVPEDQFAYVRVKAQNTGLGLESFWSDPMKILVVPTPDLTGFLRINGPSIIFD